ncbi:MAG: dihydrolipoyl dehydrogenase [Campylobacteraceae bacterium]|nr:dihydrolipoyl dehydrogenase [Campylobacteraceae bacterium]
MYDVIVIGAGPAGYEVASLLGSAGKSVCIIDKSENRIGGTCLNEGCVPAKNFLETSSYIKKAAYFKTTGVNFTLDSFDIEGLKKNTSCLITDLTSGIQAKLKKAKVEIKYGNASFVGETSIKIDGDNQEVIEASKIVIATGSVHREHPLMNLVDGKILSSKEVFSINEIPKSILVIGGGAIGCEFASFFASFGTEVDIAEFTPRLVPIEDDDIARTLKRELEKQGMSIYLNANVTSYTVNSSNVEVTMTVGKKEQTKVYDKVLVSIGRNPNTNGLNAEAGNVTCDRGFVEVDGNLQSISNKNVYAIGDVIKTPALAHVAYYEAKRVAAIICEEEVMSEKAIFPSVTFCTPQIASIGQSERALKEAGITYKASKIFFKVNGKAKIKGDDSGFVKIIHEVESGKILGAAIIGNDATELIHQFLIAINTNLSMDDLSKMIFAHPTLSETILDLVSAH